MSDLLYNPQNLTVMIVDDHDPIRKGIKRVVLSMGFGDVIECFDGDDAIKTLVKKPIDLLICDLYMRNISGFEVLEHIRNRDIGSDIPVIVVTGEASKEEIVKVADLGAEDYVLKPFQAQDLEKKVIRTLNKFYSPSPLLKAMRKAERNFLAKNYQAALASYDEALKIDAESARAALGKALTLEKLERDEEAILLLHDNIKKNHSFHRNYAAIADMYLKHNQVADSIDALKRELEINPKQPTRQIHLAKLLLKEGDPNGAIDHYRAALKDAPNRLPALMGMGHAYAMTENLDKALYYFKRVRRYHPTATKALEAAVRCATQANEPKKAEMFLREERAQHPDRTDTHILLAMFYLRQERDDEALKVCEDLQERDPENAQAMKMKATIYLKKKDYTNAINALAACAKIAPSAEVFASLGEAYVGLSKFSEALDTLHKALSMNPDNGYALFLLAETHRKSQQWIKAYYLYRRAAASGAYPDKCKESIKECLGQIMGRRRFRAAS